MGTVQELSVLKGGNRYIDFQPLHRILEENINRGCGDKTAIISTDFHKIERNISYSTLNSNANRLARFFLQQIGERKLDSNRDGDWIIAVCMAPSDELLTTLLAIWKTGAAYLPIDPSFPANRIEHILNEAEPVLVIYDKKNIDTKLFGNTAAMPYDNCEQQSATLDGANIAVNQTVTGDKGIDLLGLVLYTSGSTGVPKGTVLIYSLLRSYFKVKCMLRSDQLLRHCLVFCCDCRVGLEMEPNMFVVAV